MVLWLLLFRSLVVVAVLWTCGCYHFTVSVGLSHLAMAVIIS